MDRHLSRLFRPRHLLVTFVVALATGAIGITVTAATGAEAPAPLPDPWTLPFAIPAPDVGDSGRFVYAGGHQDNSNGYFPSEVRFEWLADGEGYTPDAARVVANRLRLDWQGYDSQVLTLAPGTSTALSQSSTTERNSTTAAAPPFFPEETSTDRSTFTFFSSGGATMWCGIKTPLQGLTIDLRQPLADRTDCWNGPGSWMTDGYSVLVHAVGGQAPTRTIVVDSFDTEDLGRLDQARPFMRSTYLEGFPYAVRVEFMSGDVGPDPGGYSGAYELSSYHRGVVPVAMEARVITPAPAPLVLAPVTETGPDLGGFGHPYPLPEAWANAKADPSFQELQDYLAAHPDAYIGQASLQQFSDDGQVSYHWYIVLTDGQAQYAFRNIHTEGPLAESPLALPLGAPLLQAGGGDSYDRLTNGWEDGPYPVPADKPTELPTIQGVAAAWATMTGRSDANVYGFDLRCSGDRGSCDVWGFVHAGASSDDTTGLTFAAGSNRTIRHSELTANATGALQALYESEDLQEYEAPLEDPTTAPGGSDEEVPVPAAQDAVVLPDASPWVPTKREAAAVGGIAVLATLGYWLWPLAKGGGVGLFSRVSKDRLLDNPLRQHLVLRIEAEPGVHHNALVRDLGKGKGAAEHHLEKLVAGGLVLRHRTPGYTCYFPVGTDRRAMAGAPATKSDGARLVLDAVARGLGGVREVAAATGLSPSTVSHHLARLRAAGLVAGDGSVGYRAVSGPSLGDGLAAA